MNILVLLNLCPSFLPKLVFYVLLRTWAVGDEPFGVDGVWWGGARPQPGCEGRVDGVWWGGARPQPGCEGGWTECGGEAQGLNPGVREGGWSVVGRRKASTRV